MGDPTFVVSLLYIASNRPDIYLKLDENIFALILLFFFFWGGLSVLLLPGCLTMICHLTLFVIPSTIGIKRGRKKKPVMIVTSQVYSSIILSVMYILHYNPLRSPLQAINSSFRRLLSGSYGKCPSRWK